MSEEAPPSMREFTRSFMLPALPAHSGGGSRDITYSTWACLYLVQNGSTPQVSAAGCSGVRFVLDQEGADVLLSLLDWKPEATPEPRLRALELALDGIFEVNSFTGETADMQPMTLASILTASRLVTTHATTYLNGATYLEKLGRRRPVWAAAHDYKPLVARRMHVAVGVEDFVAQHQAASRSQPKRAKNSSAKSGRTVPDRSPTSSSDSGTRMATSATPPAAPVPPPTAAAPSTLTTLSASMPPPPPPPGINLEHLNGTQRAAKAETVALFGGCSDLVLVADTGVHWLHEMKLPSAFTDEEFYALYHCLAHEGMTMKAVGYEPGQPLDRSKLAIEFRIQAVTEPNDTVCKVVAQVFQQMILNKCPRLLLSNWNLQCTIRLGRDGRIYVSPPFGRNRVSPGDMERDESPLELFIAIELSAMWLAYSELHPQPSSDMEKIWGYNGTEWFPDATLGLRSIGVLEKRKSGSASGGGQDSVAGNTMDQDDEVWDDAPPAMIQDDDSDESVLFPSPKRDKNQAVRLDLGGHIDPFMASAEDMPIISRTMAKLGKMTGALHPVTLGSPLSDVLGPSNVLRPTMYLGRGRSGIVFRVVPGETSERAGEVALVIKVMDTTMSSALADHPSRYSNTEQVVQAAHDEAALYLGPLRQLQGIVVPVFYGLFRAGDFLLGLFSDAGRPAAPDTLRGPALATSLAPYSKSIIDAYTQLHAAGVAHIDVAPRHVLAQNGSTNVSILDFEGSVARAVPITLQNEDRAVFAMLQGVV